MRKKKSSSEIRRDHKMRAIKAQYVLAALQWKFAKHQLLIPLLRKDLTVSLPSS